MLECACQNSHTTISGKTEDSYQTNDNINLPPSETEKVVLECACQKPTTTIANIDTKHTDANILQCNKLPHKFHDMVSNIYIDDILGSEDSLDDIHILKNYAETTLGKYQFEFKSWDWSHKIYEPLGDQHDIATNSTTNPPKNTSQYDTGFLASEKNNTSTELNHLMSVSGYIYNPILDTVQVKCFIQHNGRKFRGALVKELSKWIKRLDGSKSKINPPELIIEDFKDKEINMVNLTTVYAGCIPTYKIILSRLHQIFDIGGYLTPLLGTIVTTCFYFH